MDLRIKRGTVDGTGCLVRKVTGDNFLGMDAVLMDRRVRIYGDYRRVQAILKSMKANRKPWAFDLHMKGAKLSFRGIVRELYGETLTLECVGPVDFSSEAPPEIDTTPLDARFEKTSIRTLRGAAR